MKAGLLITDYYFFKYSLFSCAERFNNSQLAESPFDFQCLSESSSPDL